MEIPLFVSTGKQHIAVLTPHQEQLIWENLNADYKIRARYLLHTAMRISEARYVDLNRALFRESNGIILLPKVEGIGKKRCTIKNRTVLLSDPGVIAVKDFFEKNTHLPSYQAMEPVFKLAAKEANIDPRYITTKMYRKTFISWMIAKYPEKESSILLSAGHTQATMRGHYLAQGFKKDDYKDIDERTRNWGMAR